MRNYNYWRLFILQEYPVIRINAVDKNKVALNTVIINPKYVDGFVWIKIPSYIKDRNFGFIGIAEVTNGDADVKTYDTVIKDPYHPWVKIKFDYLNQNPGYHMYKLSFANRFTNDVISVYFAYQYQMDNPEKPYDYMAKYRTHIDEDEQ